MLVQVYYYAWDSSLKAKRGSRITFAKGVAV